MRYVWVLRHALLLLMQTFSRSVLCYYQLLTGYQLQPSTASISSLTVDFEKG